MKRRLYYLFSNRTETEKAVNDLLLKHVPIGDIHVMGPSGVDMGDLPQATALQKTDMVRGIFIGLLLGGIVGLVGGIIGHYVVDMPVSGAVVASTILGALIGAWSSGLIALSAPNARLRRFQKKLTDGHFLIILDLPQEKVATLDKYIREHHPSVTPEGSEATFPSFP